MIQVSFLGDRYPRKLTVCPLMMHDTLFHD